MNSIAEYLVSVTGAAIVCGSICSLYDKSKPGHSVVRLICGVFLLTIMLTPVVQLDIEFPITVLETVSKQTNDTISQSVSNFSEEYESRIKYQIEAYIQQKLESMNCKMKTEVSLQEEYPYAPVHIKLTGTVSPYDRSCISSWLSTELGISSEEQTWNG